MATLEESALLVDRALVTLCQELPESLGLYNTGKDQFSLAAMRGVPLLERLEFESRKHFILRDWMRSYAPGEDQALSTEISIDSLRETMRRERKERQRLEQQQQDALRAADGLSAEERKKQRKKEKRAKEKEVAKQKTRSSSSSSSKKAKAKTKSKAKAKPKRKSRHDSDSDNDFVVGDDEISMESSSSESSTSSSSEGSASSDEETKESERGKKKSSSKKKKKVKSNLPALEDVVSSDEDEEPNEMFDTEDPDVYEVETILDKRSGRGGDPEYLIKWVGYEETTWEPASNVSKDLVDEFEGQPVRENEYAVEEIRDRRAKRDPETRLKTHEYRVKWVGYDEETWEPAENLPHNLRRKFDQKYEARKRRRR